MRETTVCSKLRPKAQIILPFHHNDIYECRHTTIITSPVH